MDSKRYIFLLIGALGLFRCGLSATRNQWLNPLFTADSPYTFEGSGDSISFPSKDYKEWSVFNASSESSEVERDYEISQEGDEEGAGMLRFNEGNLSDEQAWLSLGISRAPDDSLQPIDLIPEVSGKLRFDNFYFKLRFAYSDAVPQMNDLLQMYSTFAASRPDESGLLPPHVAAKLGICVLQDGYYHISRVESLAGTGTADDLVFTFCKTNHRYTGGTVTIRIEFQTYLGTAPDDYPVRAYRIFAKPEGGSEVCLTKGLGYRWKITETSGYAFDFSSFEDGEDCAWLYPLDNAYALVASSQINPETGEGPNVDISGLQSIQQVAFSATDGGFYSAWMSLGGDAPTEEEDDPASELDGYELGAFEPFADDPALDAWLAAYDVDLTQYLSKTEDTSEAPFNAFLLNLDPEMAPADLSLRITGIVPDAAANTVTLTVLAPAGSTPVNDAARLCVRRAKTLDELADAEPVYYTFPQAPEASDSAKHIVTLVIPYALTLDSADADEYPFMKVTLLSREDPAIRDYSGTP